VWRAAKAPARPQAQDAPPTWPPPKPAERAKREQPLLWVRGTRVAVLALAHGVTRWR
jgi:hypothetical protein